MDELSILIEQQKRCCNAARKRFNTESRKLATLKKRHVEQDAKKALESVQRINDKTMIEIVEPILRACCVTYEQVISSSKNRRLTDARRIICQSAYQHGFKQKRIKKVVNRDHSDVVYLLNTFEILYGTSRDFRELCEKCSIKFVGKLEKRRIFTNRKNQEL